MIRICVVMVIGMFGLFNIAQAQTKSTDSSIVAIGSYSAKVSFYKTTNIIFPYALKSIDRGSRDVLVQRAKGVDNILQLKAARPNFSQTNLSIVTTDGHFYSFLLDYACCPDTLNLLVKGDAPERGHAALLSSPSVNAQELSAEMTRALSMRSNAKAVVHSQNMVVGVDGIYFHDNTMIFRLTIANHSMVAYKASYVRFYIQDRHRGKRTAIQQKEVVPVVAADLPDVEGGKLIQSAFAFTAFTIPKSQQLIVEIGEVSGGRTIKARVKSKLLLKAGLL